MKNSYVSLQGIDLLVDEVHRSYYDAVTYTAVYDDCTQELIGMCHAIEHLRQAFECLKAVKMLSERDRQMTMQFPTSESKAEYRSGAKRYYVKGGVK